MREIISTKPPGTPQGPYSQGVKVGNLVWTAGMAANDAATGELLYPDDISKQTTKTLENLQETLEKAGTSLANAIKVSAFIHDIDEWPTFNEAYKAFFASDPPARTTIAVCGLPKGMCVEIDLVAVVPD
ncbi:RidA family protein [Candidatus Poribacteria bacterium]|jgi:2-iminobutanoate/2-iminopropanoate deaminase|nr:RidA family protein [Candidatus Poribacteria bacterium]MBT5534684.1 RidA family protein [Candidatus Poribacteria bacterium]MBT5713056.1 RidA family protein [Candidatus Poribacteria bacterium]MBT7096307.1 RidA family protein [Candidatus Poribacteria bacterium]MBT7806720.1 RidA family protein [Candidatus Poribacteria bacterium]